MIHETAIVHPRAYVDPTAEIGPFCIIGSDHGNLDLGPGTIVRSHSVVEGGSTYGDGLEVGHHALLRTGNKVGANLRIGTGSSLEGGAVIGDYVRIHGRAEMTKAIVNDFARIYADCYITDNRLPPSNVNEPAIIDEGAVLTIGCVVVAGVRVGIGSFVGANTTVTKDVPDATALVGGTLKPITALKWKNLAYPWTNHYRDGYPPEALPRLEELHQRILQFLPWP